MSRVFCEQVSLTYLQRCTIIILQHASKANPSPVGPCVRKLRPSQSTMPHSCTREAGLQSGGWGVLSLEMESMRVPYGLNGGLALV